MTTFGVCKDWANRERQNVESLTRHFNIHGRVQGVGFRWSLHAKAKALGLVGWVRNCRDGSVEAVACGTPEAVEELTVWVWHGPPSARVDDVQSHDEPESSDPSFHSGFRQRPTY